MNSIATFIRPRIMGILRDKGWLFEPPAVVRERCEKKTLGEQCRIACIGLGFGLAQAGWAPIQSERIRRTGRDGYKLAFITGGGPENSEPPHDRGDRY